jgi:hypothetical protein
MNDPEAGDPIPGTGGFTQLRFGDTRCGKGKCGGLRVISYSWNSGYQFWLFTLYDKDEIADLMPNQRPALKAMIKTEFEIRTKK